MKKLTVASLFALSAVAASAQTTLYGQVGLFADSTKTGSRASVQTMQDNSSRVGISFQERVSKNLTVAGVVETSVNVDDPLTSGTQLGNRQSTLGVRSGGLSVDVGRKFNSHYLNVGSADPFTSFYFDVGDEVNTPRGTRMSEGVFVSFAPVKNLTMTLDRSLSGGATETTIVGASTNVLGVQAGVTHFKNGGEESTGVSLKTTVSNVTLAYAGSDNKGVAPSRGHLVSVSYPIGAFVTKASYGKTNTNVTGWNVGVDYNLSKRTSLHAAYRDLDRVGSAQDSKQLAVGVIHRF